MKNARESVSKVQLKICIKLFNMKEYSTIDNCPITPCTHQSFTHDVSRRR